MKRGNKTENKRNLFTHKIAGKATQIGSNAQRRESKKGGRGRGAQSQQRRDPLSPHSHSSTSPTAKQNKS